MNPKISNQFSGLFHNNDTDDFNELEKYSITLRDCAHNMVAFINRLQDQTKAIKLLKEAYTEIETMPAKKLCYGIEKVKNSLLKVEFLAKNSELANKNQADFIDFFELQNIFNAEVNNFVKKVIQLEICN